MLLQDLRYAARQLRKSPGFTGLVVLTISLGIGANTAMFSVLNGFLRPLPVPDPDRIVVLAEQNPNDEAGMGFRFSYPALTDLRHQTSGFSDIFASNTLLGGLNVNGKITQFVYSAVTGNFFTGLGLRPAAGRVFLPGEGERSGSELIVVLGYSCWQKRFGGDPGAIGRQVRIDGATARVIGVVPKEFYGVQSGLEVDGYLPLNYLTRYDLRAGNLYTTRDRHPLVVHGRLKPGVSMEQARGSVEVVSRRMGERFPASDKGFTIRVIPERLARPLPIPFLERVIPLIRFFLLLLAGMVLLLACMNVANLMLVRATIRQREMAIRAALGSGRARLIRQMLTESLLLALLGGVAGVLMGKWGSDVFIGSIHAGTDFPITIDFHFDWNVFVYALVAAVFTGVLIGTWPAIRACRAQASAALHEGARGDSAGGASQRVRGALVVAQVAGSLVLLIVAGLFVRSLQNAQRLDLGFNPDRLVIARMDPNGVGYDEPRTRQFYKELKRRVSALPGAQSVSIAFRVPMSYVSSGDRVFFEDKPLRPGEQPPGVGDNSVDSDYFDTMRIPIVRGRAFRESDHQKAPLVAIVNQTMAARYWPNEDVLGKRFRLSEKGPWWQVVGVARDSKYTVVFESAMSYFYMPIEQNFTALRVLQVRSTAPPQQLAAQIQREIQALDPDIPVADLETMQESLAGGMGYMMFRIGAMQAGSMGVLGLILAGIGVYGVVSYGASQRTREIGIRMALGAHPREVARLVLGHGVRLVIAGVVLGLAGAVAVTRLAARFLVFVSSTDPVTYIVVPAVLCALALWACYLPARRAMKVDPMIALRHE